MKAGFILLTLLVFSNVSWGDWLESQKSRIEAVGDKPTISELDMLNQLVGNEPDSERKAIIRELAWHKLQTIPDFPEQIRDHILKKKEEFKSAQISLDDYQSARHLFGPLGRVPDPRVVGLLGEFLHDEDWPAGKSLEAELDKLQPNSVLAMRTLGNLLEKPAVQGEPSSYQLHDVATWQLWYEQVKAGTRTFRFKGDPQEYSLTGPVREAREPKTTRPAIVSNSAQKGPTETANKTTGIPIWPLTIAGVILAVAIWFATKRKSSAA